MDQASAPQQNNAKLFVGNLNYQVTSEDLRAKFAEFGEVIDCIVLTDKFSGRSKGFGFVTFASDEQAQTALDATNGQPLMERAMAVSIARPPQPRENRGGGGFRSGGGSGDRRGGFSRGGSSSSSGGFRRDNRGGGYSDNQY